MIISASRRTDIPAYYWEWMKNRIKEGFVCVRNSYNEKQVSRVSLSADKIDCYVFWTKNCIPISKSMDILETVPFYIQHTITGYGKDIERNLSDKENICKSFRAISQNFGRNHIIWRYDPIFISPSYTLEWHKETFKKLASSLADHTIKCTVSFLDTYGHILPWMNKNSVRCLSWNEQNELISYMADIADQYGIYIDTCAEKGTYPRVRHASCIDKSLCEKICGYPLEVEKDKTQRKDCGCMTSIDIGFTTSCLNGCAYCYATFGQPMNNYKKHNPNSPLLIGEITEDDKVTDRKISSFQAEPSLF